MEKKYISNSEESVRMFKSNLLEPLTKVHFTVPLILFIPVIIYFTWEAFVVLDATVWQYAGFYIVGLVIWSLVEYIMHRFVFHLPPKGAIMERMHFIFHGVHHDYPNDRLRLVLPPSVSIPLALLLYFIFAQLFNPLQMACFFPGFITGYLIYDIGHYAMHHYNFKSGIMKKVKQHHMLHHYSDDEKGYGVSTPLWDWIFGSDFPKKKKKK